jgi:hypothetical protein
MMQGHCLCGAVSITVSGDHDPRIGVCHCRMCQRWSGGVFLLFNAKPEAVKVIGEVRRYASSDFAERAFCPICGSNLWMRNTTPDDAEYGLMPGLFDEARSFPLRSEIYTDRALESVRLQGNHMRATRAEYETQNLHIEGDYP